jgi:hypothetical protein
MNKMTNNHKTNIKMNKSLQVTGLIILMAGLALLLHAQLNMETSIMSDYGTPDTDGISSLPQRISNIGLIADKLNYTVLGGILLIVGLQLTLVPNEIKPKK